MAARNSPPEPAARLTRLRKRADFLAAARGVRRVSGAITLELAPTPDLSRAEGALRVGFTASRKIGNAVARNRAKRRLRAAASEQLPLLGRTGHDYVLVARASALRCPYAALLQNLAEAIGSAHRKLDAGKTGA